jgi:hypothetical protein
MVLGEGFDVGQVATEMAQGNLIELRSSIRQIEARCDQVIAQRQRRGLHQR